MASTSDEEEVVFSGFRYVGGVFVGEGKKKQPSGT